VAGILVYCIVLLICLSGISGSYKQQHVQVITDHLNLRFDKRKQVFLNILFIQAYLCINYQWNYKQFFKIKSLLK